MLPNFSNFNDKQLYKASNQKTKSQKYSLNSPQPSPKQQHKNQTYWTKNESPQQKQWAKNQVLKSSDFLESFGRSTSYNDIQRNDKSRQKSSSYFLKRMGITQKQLDKNYRKSPYSSQSYSAYPTQHQFKNYQTDNYLQQNYDHKLHDQNKKYSQNRDKFYDLLYKLIGILGCHTRLSLREVFKQMKALDSQKNYNKKLYDQYYPQSNTYNGGYKKSQEYDNNIFGQFQKVQTKIDRLASVNIDIQSNCDKQGNQDGAKQYDLHSLSINSQTKSDINSHYNKLSPKQKKQVFNFDKKTQKSYFNPDRNIDYGFDGIVAKKSQQIHSDINKSTDHNKTVKRKKQNSYQLPRNPNCNQQYIQPQKSKNKYQKQQSNQLTTSQARKSQIQHKLPQWLSTHINQEPIIQEYSNQNYSTTLRQIYHLNPDTFKDSSPDFYQPIIPEIQLCQDIINTSLERQLAKNKQQINSSGKVSGENLQSNQEIFEDYVESNNFVGSLNQNQYQIRQQSRQASEMTGANLIHPSIESNKNSVHQARPVSTFNDNNQRKPAQSSMEKNIYVVDYRNSHNGRVSEMKTQLQNSRRPMQRNYSDSCMRPKSMTATSGYKSPEIATFKQAVRLSVNQQAFNERPKSNIPYNQIVNFNYQNGRQNTYRNQYEVNQFNQRNIKTPRALSSDNIKYKFNYPQEKPRQVVKFQIQSPASQQKIDFRVNKEYGRVNPVKTLQNFNNNHCPTPSNISSQNSANPSQIHKKLPIYYGIASPKSTTPSSYMISRQSPRPSEKNKNGLSGMQKQEPSRCKTRQTHISINNESNLQYTGQTSSREASYLSPKSHYGIERRPNQRIHIVSSKKNLKD